MARIETGRAPHPSYIARGTPAPNVHRKLRELLDPAIARVISVAWSDLRGLYFVRCESADRKPIRCTLSSDTDRAVAQLADEIMATVSPDDDRPPTL